MLHSGSLLHEGLFNTFSVPLPRSLIHYNHAFIIDTALSVFKALHETGPVSHSMITIEQEFKTEFYQFSRWILSALIHTSPPQTHFLPDSPAVSFIFISMKAPIWLGEYSFPWDSTQASPLEARTILKGTFLLGGKKHILKIKNYGNKFITGIIFSGVALTWTMVNAQF